MGLATVTVAEFKGNNIFSEIFGLDAGLEPLTLANLRLVNRVMRGLDRSDKWPVCGRFNVTERAIRAMRRNGWLAYCATVQDYVTQVDSLISSYVDDAYES